MDLRSDMRQNVQGELDFSSSPAGEAREAGREGTESFPAVHGSESPASTNRLMEEVCERGNLKEALRRVKANKGSPGVDGMTVGGITGYLKQHWPAIREQLLQGTYEPQPVRRVEIPKPDGGGVRKLGIPSVLDRFIQQPSRKVFVYAACIFAPPLGGMHQVTGLMLLFLRQLLHDVIQLVIAATLYGLIVAENFFDGRP